MEKWLAQVYITDKAVYIRIIGIDERIPYEEIEAINVNHKKPYNSDSSVIKGLYIVHHGRFIKVPSDLVFYSTKGLAKKATDIIRRKCLMNRVKMASKPKDLADEEQELWEYIENMRPILGYTKVKKLPIFNNEVLVKIEEWFGEKHRSLLRGKRGKLYYPDWINPIFLFKNWVLRPYQKPYEKFFLIHKSQINFFTIHNYYIEEKHVSPGTYSYHTGMTHGGGTHYTTHYDHSNVRIYTLQHGKRTYYQIGDINFHNLKKWIGR